MTHAAAFPTFFAPQRLWLARALAWALLLGGWMVLGALGRQHLPLLAGGQVPVASWLLVIGVLLTGAARWQASTAALRWGVLGAGAAGTITLALTAGATIGLLTASAAWAALLVAASLTVRRLRLAQAGPPPAPIAPAAWGALLAWGVVGDLDAVRQSPLAVGIAFGLAALLLAGLMPARASKAGGCRAGLFDCSLPLLSPGRWRHAADWPQSAAALAMLPMMAALPTMADWCGERQWPTAAGTALHLGAMLLPALLSPLTALPGRRLASATGLLLVLGGAALLLWPGLPGLMAASLLHGLAWSLAWAGMLRPRPTTIRNAAAPRPSEPAADRPIQMILTVLPILTILPMAHRLSQNPPHAEPARHEPAAVHARQPASAMWRPAALTACAVLLLGLLIDQAGPAALIGVHAVLAMLGLIGLLALAAGGRTPTLNRESLP